MKMEPKERFTYIIRMGTSYLRIFKEENGQKYWEFTPYRSDAKKFGSTVEAREYAGEIGGCRIHRYDTVTGTADDVGALIRDGVERDWR